MRVFRMIALTASLLAGLAGSARAQAVGQIVGVVTDATGGVLPGVTVTVSGTGLLQPLVRSTNPDGTYTVPEVPIGTYVVAFEMHGFKRAVRDNVVLNTGFTAKVDMTLAVGTVSEQVEVTGAPPLVDTKRTTTGATVSLDVMNGVPTARDPWQVINLAPSVVMNGFEGSNTLNIGGSAAGTQQNVQAFGQLNGSVMWNLEGGSITDMSSNSAATYFNFDSFQEIQVITGGGDASIQASGVYINLVTKSGSNVRKGSVGMTFENAAMQAQNVTQAIFDANTSGNAIGLSGNPLHRVDTEDGDIGGPISKNRLWYWGSVSNQDINLSVANYFNTSRPGCNPPPSTFAQLADLQACLENTRTLLVNVNGKLNYQLNTANKFQVLVQTAQKTNNSRYAGSLVTSDATASQYATGGVGLLEDPTYQVTHTWLPTDRLVIVNQLTYLRGGFSVDFHDVPRCGATTYARDLAGGDPMDPTCQWNIQPLENFTTGLSSRSSLGGGVQTERRSWEAKSDGTYFLPHFLGGDHALKFGVGWRKDPTLSYSHYGGGAIAEVQCVNNTNCGDGVSFVVPGSPVGGLVPDSAELIRDGLFNIGWHTYFGYAQDALTLKRTTVTAGLRDDWQTSVNNGGCVRANVIEPTLLPAQCQGLIDPKQPFNSIAPRASVTYDLTGKGTTAVHASFGMYYQTLVPLANALNDLTPVALAYSSNQKSGACSTVAGASCWNDANHDGVIQASELSGIPQGPSNFINGVLNVIPPTVDPDLKPARTREGIGGFDQQLLPNVHVMFDFIYRDYDRGLVTYIAAPSGTGAAAVAQIVAATTEWQPNLYTDPNTGISTTYYTLCPACAKLTGGKFTTTSLQYTLYKGTVVTLTKRLSSHWQGSLSYNWNDPRVYVPVGSFSTNGANPGNPTNIQYQNGFTNGTLGWTVKAFASAELPFGLMAGMNLNIQDGVVRNTFINGPGTVASGTSSISYGTLQFQDKGSSRTPATKVLDVNLSKTFPLGRQRLTLTLNCFNIFNVNTALLYTSDDASNNGVNGSIPSFNSIASIVPPRIFRIDTRFSF